MRKPCHIFAVSHEPKHIEKELAAVRPFLKPGVKVAIESSTQSIGRLAAAEHTFFGQLAKAVLNAGAVPVLLYQEGEGNLWINSLFNVDHPQANLGRYLRPALSYLRNREAIDQELSRTVPAPRRKRLERLKEKYAAIVLDYGQEPSIQDLENSIALSVSRLRENKPKQDKLLLPWREDAWQKILSSAKPDIVVAGFKHLPAVVQAVEVAGMHPEVKYLAASISKRIRKMRRRAYGYDHAAKTWRRSKTLRP